jgi:pilus assembly protein CpaC
MRTSLSVVVGLIVALSSASAFAEDDDADAPSRVSVSVSGSRYLKLGDRITSVSVASKDIAELAAFPPNQVLITGKQVGQTTATVWSGAGVEVLLIDVTYALDDIRASLRKALPDAENVDAAQAGTALVLSGEVASVADIGKAEEIARGFIGDGQIINLLGVPGDQQVQLEVSFAEVSRSALREVGFNFWSKGKANAGGLLAPTTSLDTLSPQLSSQPDVAELNSGAAAAVPIVGTPLSGTFGAIFSTALGDFPFSAALSILSNKGYARVMAEPTLVAMSGESASFLAGGEFPIPLPQSLGQIGVEYKKFGIQLEFMPTVVGDDIQVAVGVTVSDIDFSLGVKLATVTVPGLVSRHADTTVRIQDGQSFVIAGLLSDKVRSNVDKVPWLGDLPILGTLFRSSSYRREETELLVVVTAHRVRPLDERPELPGEHEKVDPSDLELFLLGRTESLAGGDPRPATANKKSEKSESAESKGRLPVGAIGFKR